MVMKHSPIRPRALPVLILSLLPALVFVHGGTFAQVGPLPGMGQEQAVGDAGGAGARKAGEARGDADPAPLDHDHWPARRILFFLAYVFGAIGSGAALAYHPVHRERLASLDEMDLPKIVITYSVVGAIAAVLVKAEPAMGLALFGIGGLMRFRTELQSPKETGRTILATVIGFLWGMQWWQISLVTTALAWLLILILDWKVGYRLIVRGLGTETIVDSASAYQAILEEYGANITRVKKNVDKGQVSLVFKAGRSLDRDEVEQSFVDEIEESLQGAVDWAQDG